MTVPELLRCPELAGRSANAVRSTCERQGIPFKKLKANKDRRPWTEEEIEFLQKRAAELTIPEIAAHLGRGEGRVCAYLDRKGIPYKHRRRWWTKGEVFKLMGLTERKNAVAAAKALGRTEASVVTKMEELDLHAYSGLYSMASLCEETGYHYTQILEARDALGMRWQRTGHRFLISECQMKRLMLYFRDPEAALKMKDTEEEDEVEEAA